MTDRDDQDDRDTDASAEAGAAVPPRRPAVDAEQEARMRERDAQLEHGGPGQALKIAGGAAIGVVVLILALSLIAPAQLASLLGRGASQVETMQDASTSDPGLSTEITNFDSGVETDLPPAATMPAQDDQMDTAPQLDLAASEAERQRIADLERQLSELMRTTAGTPQRLESLLAEQAAQLEAQFERERLLAEEAYQRQLQDAIAATSGGDGGEAEARRRLEEERERRKALEEAQIASDGLVLDGSGSVTGGGAGGTGSREMTDNESFMAQASTAGYDTARATAIANPGRTIVQGTTLEAVLETAVSTELPGVIRAVVSTDVYSYDGANVLLPRGTRLIGSYNSDVSIAQGRAQLAWNRAITPDGISVALGGYGADQLGMSGQSGFVDTRFGERFGTAALISILGVTPQLLVSDSGDENTVEIAENIGEDLENTTQSVMSDYLSLPPVIYIDQGTRLTVFVNRDLVF